MTNKLSIILQQVLSS